MMAGDEGMRVYLQFNKPHLLLYHLVSSCQDVGLHMEQKECGYDAFLSRETDRSRT